MPSTRPVVLVLDDDRATRELVQEVLEEHGYAVESAASGASGQARLEAGGIDLVVLDKRLPDGDGLDVCRWVRARERRERAHLPIIMVSAALDPSGEDLGPDAGADAYVAKPFDLDALVAQVRSSLASPSPGHTP
ncbi:MAG TPA: response regulator transcription factor [Chloroflexota bacterium]|nr:response regulator transcription factor [Chloroflexota bacterium]